jgi:hypothetical protein
MADLPPAGTYKPPDNEVLVSRIAREIARDLSPVDMIRDKFHLTEDEYNRVLTSPIFKQRLEEELAVWNASDALSIADRIKLKAGTMIEESLLEVYELIHDKSQPMVAKIRALEWASRMAGVGETERLGALPPGATGGGSGINFNIFIGGEKQSFSQPATQPRIIEGEVVLNDKEPVP